MRLPKQSSGAPDALRWIDGNQAGRRNEPAFVRIEAVLEHKAEIEEKARANQGARNDIRPNSDEGLRTDETLADMANVGRTTLREGERLREEAAPELLDALRRDEVSIHLASQVIDLPDEERTQAIEAMSTVDRLDSRSSRWTYPSIKPRENTGEKLFKRPLLTCIRVLI